jgi:hypothetical protein
VDLYLSKSEYSDTFCGYALYEHCVDESIFHSTNPTDALIDLLIWVKIDLSV